MYEKYFYLREKPFHITPDPRFLYLSEKHREAMDLLRFGIFKRKGFIVLTGEVGTGKTTLCRALLGRLPEGVATALIMTPILTEDELLRTITGDFGLEVSGESPKAHLDALNAFLLETASEGKNAAVIIDEAQNLSPAALEMLRLLSNLETDTEKLLQVVMVGQPELREKLSMPELRQLNQRVIVRHHLEPLSGEETAAYIQNRLLVAGGSVRFTDEASGLVHEKSTGIPRKINIICDRALMAAFVAEKKAVDEESVRAAATELEEDGYLASPRFPLCLRFIPHATAFAAACLAGIYWGPAMLKTAITGLLP